MWNIYYNIISAELIHYGAGYEGVRHFVTNQIEPLSESESESEFHLFEPHIYIQKKYLNMISDCKMWIGRPLLRPVWSLSQGPPKL